MKKTIVSFLSILLALPLAVMLSANLSFAQVDTSEWYIYNGSSETHSFSVKFPTDWKSKTFGDDLQGFAPTSENENIYFYIKEFEGKTYSQAMNYYVDSETGIVQIEDIILENGEDLIAKRVTYESLGQDTEFTITFVKRGLVIFALYNPENEYTDITTGIYESFRFTDNWHQYIDYADNYTFIFPALLKMETLGEGVRLYDSSSDQTIFEAIKYEGVEIEDVSEEAEGSDETLLGEEEISFHGYVNVISALYLNTEDNKEFSRIFIEFNGNSYGFTNLNTEVNYPHDDYYEEDVLEMVESVEFFDLESEGYAYAYFPDVRENHPNVTAIDSLTGNGIINGYPDGTFRPDGEINRAELTTLVVAVVKDDLDQDEYKDCFPDVTDQWFASYVCYAYESGWVDGYADGSFKPGNNINRVEAIKVVLEVLFDQVAELDGDENTDTTDVDLSSWYGKYFYFAETEDLLDLQHVSNNKYKPGDNMTRKEVAEMIYRSLEK